MRRSALALLACIGAGCHSPLAISHAESGLVATQRFEIIRGIDLPKVSGVEGCGAQALAATIAFVNSSVEAESLAADLPWHVRGATPVELLLEARLRGCEAIITQGTWESLTEHVRAGRPVIVMIDAGYEVRWLFSRYDLPPVMHWAVVSGISVRGDEVLIAARGGRHHRVDRESFERRWERSDRCLISIASPEGGGGGGVDGGVDGGEYGGEDGQSGTIRPGG